ncbi:MAG: hypothetical protein NTV52_23385 [Acidobacteria bacterium]|nr:hypothetical protein [Acidobacteriota bacterium]
MPLWFKLAYTAFCAILIPCYLRDYGPTNFLYFCDVALHATLVGIWTESALLISAPTVGILVPQVIWGFDFLGTAMGFPLTGMTACMFNDGLPLFTRGLSFFHFWLPFALGWLVWRLGYDHRGLRLWTATAWVLLFICYFLMPAPPTLAANPNLPVSINYGYGMSDAAAQTWMPPTAWFLLIFFGLPTVVFYPTHLLLSKLARTVICPVRM